MNIRGVGTIDDSRQDDLEQTETETQITFRAAVLILTISVLSLVIGSLVLEFEVGIILLFVAMFTTAVFTFYYNYSWEELLEEGAIPMLSRAMGPILILLTVGILIGVWVISGTIPYLMYIGMQFLSPSIFLVATVIILSVGALVTGTSWGAGATFGVALDRKSVV